MDVIENIQVLAMAVVFSLAIIGRLFVFCYWWVTGAWQDEKCTHAGGHNYEVVVTDKQATSEVLDKGPIPLL